MEAEGRGVNGEAALAEREYGNKGTRMMNLEGALGIWESGACTVHVALS